MVDVEQELLASGGELQRGAFLHRLSGDVISTSSRTLAKTLKKEINHEEASKLTSYVQ